MTDAGELRCEDAAGREAHRVGYAPEPWAWTPWQYAENGRFGGRWDDPDGLWRSLYVGQSRLACYLEVLAPFRPDAKLQEELADIVEDPEDALLDPTLEAGLVPPEWREPRRIGAATLTGWYAVPAAKESLPTLRARFLRLATRLQLPDVDAAAVRLAEPRAFTQAIAGWLYEQDGPDASPLAGVRFESRHGDGLGLWAVFERAEDGDVSGRLAQLRAATIPADDPEREAPLRLHRLRWARPSGAPRSAPRPPRP